MQTKIVYKIKYKNKYLFRKLMKIMTTFPTLYSDVKERDVQMRRDFIIRDKIRIDIHKRFNNKINFF